MRPTIWHALAPMVLLAPARPCHAAQPPVFADLSLPAATARADATDRVLVVVFTADWCAPCQAMDQAVWPDPAVTAWLDEHAVAIELDFDTNQALAIDWQISAIPAIIIRNQGAELIRLGGYRSPSVLLDYFSAISDTRDSHKLQVRLARQKLGPALVAHDPLQATRAALTLIEHLPPTADQLSPLLATLRRLARIDPDARHLIEAAQQRLDPKPRLAPWDHPAPWLVLSRALDDNAVILDWFDQLMPDPRRTPSRATTARLADLADLLAPVLVEHHRFAALVRLRPDPLGWLERTNAGLVAIESITPDPDQPLVPAIMADDRPALIRQVAALHAGLLAFDRPVDAARLRARARELLPAPNSLEDHFLDTARRAIPDRARLASLLAGDPLAARLADAP